jgi:hypothetical protein
MMYKLRPLRNQRLMKMIYYAFFQSHLQYCLASYGNAFTSTLEPIRLLQKRALRLVGTSHDTQILLFDRLYIYRCLCLYHRKNVPIKLEENRSTRGNRFKAFRCATTRGQQCLSYKVTTILNQNPQFADFMHKKSVKTYLLH